MHFKSLANPLNEKKDVVIVSLPWVNTDAPLMAPATLKPIVEKAGYSCISVDLNCEARDLVISACTSEEQIKDIANYFNNLNDPYCNKESGKVIEKLFLQIANQILSFNPKFVGLSAFAWPCRPSVKWISYLIKKANPSIKIIIGGPGVIGTNFTGRSEFVDELIDNKFVDYHIRGDGEHALYELLTGNEKYSGINSLSWTELSNEDLSKIPIPDYSDYQFSFYKENYLGIVGSRGCVRKCTYCDYIENWKKFVWRTSDDIFAEMVHQNKKHGIRSFKFQDALVNGNLKEFNRLMELLAEWNTNNPDNSFSWTGYYIFREKTANDTKNWEMIAKSGATTVLVGVENFNEHIRYAMGKKFSNKSLEFHLEQAQKHNIKVAALMIVGYVNEVQQDIDAAKQWLIDNVRFRPTIQLSWGGSLGILENTYLIRNENKLGIKISPFKGPYWVNESINSTPEIRARWTLELMELSKSLGFVVEKNLHHDAMLERLVNGE